MKIAVVVNSIEFSKAGGVGSFVFELCKAFLTDKQEILIIGIIGSPNSWNDSMVQELQRLGAKIECLELENAKTALLECIPCAVKIRKILKRFSGGDNIICNVHLKLSVLIGTIAGIGIPYIKVVETYHSQYSRYWLQSKVLSLFIDYVICCSESAFKEYLYRFKRRKGVCAIANGIDMKRLRNNISSFQNAQKERMLFCSVGRLSRQKGLETTICAMNTMNNEKINYVIVGDGEEKKNLVQKITNKNIYLMGSLPRNEALKIVRDSDMVLMPSLWEGLSIFQLEAMALGKPMMLSDIAAFRQVFNERPLDPNEEFRVCQWGYLISTNNPVAWEGAISHFIANRDLKSKMGDAMLKISSCYDISRTARGYLDVFKYMLEEKRI